MQTRRRFLKASAALATFPAIVPSSVFGQNAPSNRITVGAIGVGRISRAHDLPGIWHLNWLQCIRSRQRTIAPVETAHRACSTCLLHHIAMKTKRRLKWEPAKERFIGDDAANAMLSRPQRTAYRLA